jgi:hypothetical protein
VEVSATADVKGEAHKSGKTWWSAQLFLDLDFDLDVLSFLLT